MPAAVRKEELIKVVPLSFYDIDKLEKDGYFPKRFSLTPRVVAWNRDEVEAWLDARQQNPDLIERDAEMMKGLEKYGRNTGKSLQQIASALLVRQRRVPEIKIKLYRPVIVISDYYLLVKQPQDFIRNR
ncbi:helix-turn-helix transcriptional regulator [Enterobacter roggenkampii]|nr:AlpA family phage regulatory protein [Enterobacter roggenkampii]OZU99292.1 hypothetical protein CIW59_01465 [Enterobacter roggenkampii]